MEPQAIISLVWNLGAWALTRAPDPLRFPGLAPRGGGMRISAHLQVGFQLHVPKLLPFHALASGLGCLFLLTTKNIFQCLLYLHVPPRMATGSPGHRWQRILQAKNIFYASFLTIRRGNSDSNSYKACTDYYLSPEAVLFLYSLLSSPKRAFLEAVFQTGI